MDQRTQVLISYLSDDLMSRLQAHLEQAFVAVNANPNLESVDELLSWVDSVETLLKLLRKTLARADEQDRQATVHLIPFGPADSRPDP